MESGKLRQVFTIEKPTTVVDSLGDRTQGWETYATIRGSLTPTSGQEKFLANQYEAEIKAIAKIRYYPGITADMRLVHNSVAYNIVFVKNIEMRNRWIHLMLSQGLRD